MDQNPRITSQTVGINRPPAGPFISLQFSESWEITGFVIATGPAEQDLGKLCNWSLAAISAHHSGDSMAGRMEMKWIKLGLADRQTDTIHRHQVRECHCKCVDFRPFLSQFLFMLTRTECIKESADERED